VRFFSFKGFLGIQELHKVRPGAVTAFSVHRPFEFGRDIGPTLLGLDSWGRAWDGEFDVKGSAFPQWPGGATSISSWVFLAMEGVPRFAAGAPMG